MGKREFKVLLIEDDEDDYVLVRDMLAETGFSTFHLDWVDSYDHGLDAVCRAEHDVVLLDYRLGERNGIEFLRETMERNCNAPTILLTGRGGFDIDFDAMKAGAADYLVKSEITADLLERVIRYSIEQRRAEIELRRYRDQLEELVRQRTFQLTERTEQIEAANRELRSEIVEKKRAEESLRESEEKYRGVVESALDVIFTVLPDGRISSLNPAFESITGWSASEWLGKGFAALIHHDDLQVIMRRFVRILSGERLEPGEIRILSKGGEYRLLEFKSVPQVKGEQIVGIVGTARDITERKLAEEKVREQKEFLANVLESLTHPFYVLDANDYTIKMANSAAAPKGFPPDATCYGLAHGREMPCDSSEHLCPLDAIKRTRQPIVTEHIHYDEKGVPRHVEVHGYPILDSSGNVSQIIEYALDITDRKRIEEELRETRDELEVRVQERTAELAEANEALRAENDERKKVEEALRLEESRLEALWELSQMTESSSEYISDFVSQQQVRLTRSKFGWLGFTGEDETIMSVNRWSEGVAGQCELGDKQMHMPIDSAGIWAAAVREGRAFVINDYPAPHPQKKGYPAGHVPLSRLMVSPVFDGNRIVAVAAVANKEDPYDATDVRQHTLLLDGMWKLIQREKAEKAVREAEGLAAIGRALSGVAHDMKTPLIAIGGFTRLVQGHLKESSPDRDKLGIVIEETGRLERMVEHMLDFSRPLELDRKIEDIGRTIEETLKVMEKVAEEKKVKIDSRSTPGLPDVWIDPIRIKQLLINLLMNAVQASQEGDSVTVFSHQDGTNLLIDVIDRGPGIPPEKRREVFYPFFTTKKGGTGLGLPIVKKIVEAHRGYVQILDNPDEGATFRVILPLKERELTAA